MELKNIFTEYDESLERTQNLDPMGLSIIWTQFGQRIFKGKISSSTWDVRSFNINLFNHYVIKNLMNEGTEDIKNIFEKDKKATIEKLIIILENMLIWSWYQDREGWERKNLLGTSKAISLWGNSDININIDITDSLSNLELLKKQKTTGINGSYKGSFISMGFFDSNYHEYFDDLEIFKELIEKNFKNLYGEVMEFFITMEVDKIPIKSYKETFAKPSFLAKTTQKFWETKLGFTEGEAGKIYFNEQLNDDTPTQKIFNDLKEDEDTPNINLIVTLEPKLSYLDTVFNYLLFCDGKKLAEVKKEEFLKGLSDLDFSKEKEIAEDGAKERLYELDKVENIKSLIDYHKNVMESRGYAPWLKIEEDKIVVDVKSKVKKELLDAKMKFGLSDMPWLHSYYLGSVRSIKKGFNDEAL